MDVDESGRPCPRLPGQQLRPDRARDSLLRSGRLRTTMLRSEPPSRTDLRDATLRLRRALCREPPDSHPRGVPACLQARGPAVTSTAESATMTKRVLNRGTLVVLEGLDKTGKTTQAKALKAALDPQTTAHVHMPRGFTHFTKKTYKLLESEDHRPESGVAKQLAHLACHAESMGRICDILTERAVLLDRWWWSAVAYGWCSGEVPAAGISRETYLGLVREVWAPLTASVIFLFDQPHKEDANNSDPIYEGYQELAREHGDVTVRIPAREAQSVTAFIVDELGRRGLLADRG